MTRPRIQLLWFFLLALLVLQNLVQVASGTPILHVHKRMNTPTHATGNGERPTTDSRLESMYTKVRYGGLFGEKQPGKMKHLTGSVDPKQTEYYLRQQNQQGGQGG